MNMCGRYTIATTPEDLADYFGAGFDEASSGRLVVPTYNASPGQFLPAITGDCPKRIDALHWGMTRERDGRVRFLINARSESVEERPAFRDSFRRRRCLVLADGFYEWKALERGKQPYRIVLETGEPFAFAGIWEETPEARRFVILTTAADPVTAPIHDRMPVILSRDLQDRWLDERCPLSDVRELIGPPAD